MGSQPVELVAAGGYAGHRQREARGSKRWAQNQRRLLSVYCPRAGWLGSGPFAGEEALRACRGAGSVLSF